MLVMLLLVVWQRWRRKEIDDTLGVEAHGGGEALVDAAYAFAHDLLAQQAQVDLSVLELFTRLLVLVRQLVLVALQRLDQILEDLQVVLQIKE